MNREFAAKLNLLSFFKPFKVGIPGYRHGLLINTADRQYEVIGPSWHLVQFLPEPHEFPAIIRDSKRHNKYNLQPAKVVNYMSRAIVRIQ
jgi:hypothetical protein